MYDWTGGGEEGRGVMVLVICIQFLQTLVVMHVKGRLEAGGKGVWGWGGGEVCKTSVWKM